MIGTLRNANILLAVVDLSAPDLLDQVELCLSVLENRGPRPAVEDAARGRGRQADDPGRPRKPTWRARRTISPP